jgi:hypothetical protein
MATTNQIIEFLEEHCTKVRHNEKCDYVELMMDNHHCVEFDGEQYYVPKECMLDPKDEDIRDLLIDNYLV